jgi:hypothetical protein
VPNVIVILSPESFRMPIAEEDFLRKEINHATAHGRNIIPVVKPGFEWSGLPDDIVVLKERQLVTYYPNMTPEVSQATIATIARYARAGLPKTAAATPKPSVD